jgi:hypothetical protein
VIKISSKISEMQKLCEANINILENKIIGSGSSIGTELAENVCKPTAFGQIMNRQDEPRNDQQNLDEMNQNSFEFYYIRFVLYYP